MKGVTFLSIILCFLSNFAYSSIEAYEANIHSYLEVFDEGNIYINHSSYPNNEFLFIEINYDFNWDFENFTYALKNETNFTNLEKVDFYTNKIIDNKKRYYYATFQKLNNSKYLLFYFNLGFGGKYSVYINPNSLYKIPKYGSVTALYNSEFYMNLTEFKMSEKIYIQIQYNLTVNYSDVCIRNIQSDYFGSQSYYNYDCHLLF